MRFLTHAIFIIALVAISAFPLVRGDYQGKKTPGAEEPQPRALALHPLKRNANGMSASPAASAAMVRLPLTFEANHGQKDPRVKFMAHGLGYELFLTSDGLTLSARHNVQTSFSPTATRKPDVVQLNFVGANRKSLLSGVEELPGKVDYFLGKPNQWHLDVPTYRKVRYSGIYPGVGLTYYDRRGDLESDFIIAPRRSPREISFAISGAIPRLSPGGDLLLRTQSGSLFELKKPTAYQMIGAVTKNVEVAYSIHGSRVEFSVGSYDFSQNLIIDPVVLYSTYLGGYTMAGDGGAFATTMAVDSFGNIYIAGVNSDQTFPVTSGSVQPNDGGFVSKIDPTGTTLIYSAVFPAELGYAGIAVHNGVAYVVARAQPGFPTTSGVFQPTTSALECPIVFALNSAGDGFVYATYLGGSSGQDIAHSIAVDNSGNAYVTGTTESNDFPTMNPLQPASAGGIDGFVSKINPLGTALVYSTYLGGNGQDELESISLDGAGNAYVAGWTDSTNFPVENAFQSTLNAGAQLSNAIVAALNSTGSSLIYSTYFGGMSVFGAGIATDSTGNATIVGFTTCDLPLKNPLQSTCSVTDTGFVAKFDSAGGLDFSTYFGGTSAAQPSSVALDGSGNIYFAGTVTGAASLPLVDPIELHGPPYNGGFIAEIDGTGASVLLSTYFGLPSGTPMGIGVDSSGNIYTAGETGQGLPVVNALDPVFLSKLPIAAVFVAKISPANAPAAAFAPAAIAFGNQLVGTTSSSTGVTLSDLGSAPLGVTSITTTGDFQQTNNCGSSVAAGASCTISVIFAPTVAGPRSGSVIVTDNAAGSPQTVVLTGNGGVPAASPSPTSLSFSNVPVNGTSSSQTVTLTNAGTADLIISQISVTGAFSESNNCGVDLPYAGELGSVGTCQINVTFSPNVSGPLSGTLSITDNAPSSPQTVALSGNSSPPGFSISPSSGSSTATVTAGQTANYSLTLAGSNGFSGQVQMTCAGAPVNATCLVSPNPVTVSGSSSAFTVAVSTQARNANVLFWPHRMMNTDFLPMVAPGLLLVVLLFMFSRKTSNSYGVWSRVRMAVLFSCLAWVAFGCGSNNGSSSTTGTPKGTYMITVSGQSGSVTESVQLTLVVN